MVKIKDNILNNKNSGFTILELLVVMTIIGILAVLGIGGFRSAQIKSRDSKRKNDLVAITKALEIYYNDKGQYPEATGTNGITGASWGGTFMDPLESSTIYMAEFPSESISANTYYYWSDNVASNNNQSYQLYARLENLNDKVISYSEGNGSDIADGYENTLCGINLLCNFGVSSQNITPLDNNHSFIDDL